MSKNFKKIVKSVIPKTVLHKIQEQNTFNQHKSVADFWNQVIDSYFRGEIEKYNFKPKKALADQKIIWQYWGQGINDNMPEIIQICFASVDAYRGDYQVIRLTDETVEDYIELPGFVREKRKNPAFIKAFFSDLLRLALLNVYGGVWLDATILLTGLLPEEYAEMEYFAFQRSDEEKNKSYWKAVNDSYFNWHPRFRVKMVNSVLFAKAKTTVIATLLDLLLFFWKTQTTIPNYFFFQILYNELMVGKLSHLRCPIVNDCIPHLLHAKIIDSNNPMAFKEIVNLSGLHKMTYYDVEVLNRLKYLLTEEKF